MGHSPSLRILFLSANRIMAPRMAIDEELTAIEHALRGRPGECGLVSQVDLTPDQFIAAIQSHPADILHISAHAENGRIHLQGKGKQSIGFGELVELLGVTAKKFGPPRLVILNACDTEAGLELLCKHVDCAIGMSTRISEHVAYLFTSTFYACLGRGLSVDQAFSVTLLRLQMSDQVSNEAPRLARREGVDTSELVLLPVRQPRGGRGARVIGNRYEVPPDNLGRGSKATVYKALDLWSDSTEHVALRLLHVNPAHNGPIVARFFHGAEQAHKLSHPNIVRVLDIGPRQEPISIT
ncbi:CHAT domain-containing protein [Nannocystis pusilla]|uniref:CHAT domain-containing protein n=1 Tax=Nannocystis pusilla TaxID=889268 RepID=A0A9X3ER35_9BACT|nr:CHAT domain-containing protein [Nannocystis pusilla]MCY1008405.1 CHAT domain-containing protein [Nannocystis pusilla]